MINSLEIQDMEHLREQLPIPCFYEPPSDIETHDFVVMWLDKLGLSIPREQCIRELNEFLPWNSDISHEPMSDRELNIKYLSTALGYS